MRQDFEEAWQTQFQRLVAFKRKYGHTRVPRFWKPDLFLARWVEVQRTRRTEGRLDRHRLERLEALGFQWRPLELVWEGWVGRLRVFRDQHGHSNPKQSSTEDGDLALAGSSGCGIAGGWARSAPPRSMS